MTSTATKWLPILPRKCEHIHPRKRPYLTNQLCFRVAMELRQLELKVLDIAKFQAFAYNHPSLLFPAFQLQHALRQVRSPLAVGH